MADEEKSALRAVLELCEQYFGKFASPVEIGQPKIMLHKFEQRVEQKRIIVEISV